MIVADIKKIFVRVVGRGMEDMSVMQSTLGTAVGTDAASEVRSDLPETDEGRDGNVNGTRRRGGVRQMSLGSNAKTSCGIRLQRTDRSWQTGVCCKRLGRRADSKTMSESTRLAGVVVQP